MSATQFWCFPEAHNVITMRQQKLIKMLSLTHCSVTCYVYGLICRKARSRGLLSARELLILSRVGPPRQRRRGDTKNGELEYMKKIGMVAAVAAMTMVASPQKAQAQLTGAGCFAGTYDTCADWALTNTSGNIWSLYIKNTSVQSQKFGELYVFIGAGSPTVSAVSSDPSGWGEQGSQNGSLWYLGILGSMTNNIQFTKGPDIQIGQSAIITFTLTGTDVAPVGVGVHSQPGDKFESQRVRFGGDGGTTSIVPEPSTYLLMASGLLGLGIAARRRRYS